MKKNIKAIVFDFDGVFVNDFTKKSAKDFCKKYRVDIKAFQSFSKVAAVGLDTDKIRELDYYTKIIREFKLLIAPKDLQKFFVIADKKHLRRNKSMFRLLSQLNKYYVTGLLTNNSRELAKRLGDAGLYEDFQKTFFSYRLKLVKPNLKIYRQVLKTLGLKPAELIFIDDSPQNVKAARACGIVSILHRDAKKTKKSLIKFVALDSTNCVVD